VAPINSEFAFLQCTAGYPPCWEELDLRVIETYRREFPDQVIGYSGHDSGISMATAAYVLGARIVEKHFTLNRAMKGTDHSFSLEPHGLRSLVRDLRRARVALGDGSKRMYQSETEPAKKMGKKLVAARDLPKGHVLREDDIAAKSPGDGLPPCELDRLVGRRLGYPVTEELPLTFDLLEDPAADGPGSFARVGDDVGQSPVAAAAGGDDG
jgi:N-acetylneuraminate synthase/sialic acid synthase